MMMTASMVDARLYNPRHVLVSLLEFMNLYTCYMLYLIEHLKA